MNCKEIAEYIINIMISRGVTIQRYDSMSTNSIYLKFDYGLAKSLRISDHLSTSNFNYKYSIITKEKYTLGNDSYSVKELPDLVYDILHFRSMKLNKYGYWNYRQGMVYAMRKHNDNDHNRFWNNSTVINNVITKELEGVVK